MVKAELELFTYEEHDGSDDYYRRTADKFKIAYGRYKFTFNSFMTKCFFMRHAKYGQGTAIYLK